MASTNHLTDDGGPATRSGGGLQQGSETYRLPGQQPKSLPECGILSKTVVESPVANYILPARIRSNLYKDLAFVGDNFVQIVELQKDGQVHEVLRKNDFRARVRNATVLGDCDDHGTDDPPVAPVKIEDVDVTMADNTNSSEHDVGGDGLPPQILVLVLENAEVLFLFINQKPDGSYEFIINNYPCETKVPYMGYHLCMDPTSRCLAIGSPEGYVLLYELESFETLNAAYARDGTFNPIRRRHAQAVHGIIHRIEFLYTRPEDNFHFIILLVLVRREGRPTHPSARISRMLTFEWVVGDDLCRVFSEEKAGLRLPPEHVMPLLIIPIKFRSSFFTVSAGEIGLVRNTVEGSPDFELLYTDSPDATPLHHGTYEPLWTAWARPFRRERYFEKRDVIYMAREDGAIIHIEIDGRDMVPSVTNVGCLNTNVNTAFAMSYDRFSDVIIIGGDSGPGGVWKLAPRTDLERITVIHNWSAVVDATTSNNTSFWNNSANTVSRADSRHRRPADSSLLRPETLYSVAGRGINGGVIEWRWGIQCRIGLDLEVPEGPNRVWVFKATSHGLQGWLGILSSPHSSTILNLEENFMAAEDLSEKDTGFDDSSSTLLARQLPDDTILQITERSISIVAPSSGKKYAFEEILERPGIRAYNAFLVKDFVVFSTACDGLCELHLVQADMNRATLINSWETGADVTAVAGFSTPGRQFVAAALSVSGTAWLRVYPVNGKQAIVDLALDDRLNEVDEQRKPEQYGTLEPATSIVVVREGGDSIDIALGTRCGHLVSARIAQNIPGHLVWQCETLGISSVELFPVSGIFNGSPAIFACCDGRLIMLHKFDDIMQRFSGKNYLFLTDSQDDSAVSPDVHSVFQMRENLTGFTGHITVTVVAGNRILVCDVWPHVGLIPRTIRLDGTPCRIFYSHTWKCLVAAVIRQDRTALDFINPATGMSISQATDRHLAPLDFITGLGHEGDRIFGLDEWSFFKDGHMFSFILVATKNGRLLIISLKEADTMSPHDSTRRTLQYWTRYRLTLNKPIYSIVGDDDGIIYCEGNTIRWDILSLADKRLRHVKEYELESPATTLRIRDGKIHAVTATQSLVVLDHRSGNGPEMKLVHTDEVSRPSIHLIELGDVEQTEADWPVTLMSDQVSRFVGMRVPRAEHPWEHEIVFEGALSTSIRRFTFGRTRPPWLASYGTRRYGTLLSDQGGVEIFGLGLDGSMHHFQLLSKPLWRFLSLVQNLVYHDTTHYPLILPRINIEPRAEDESLVIVGLRSKTAHIDGDVLERCVLDGTLRELVEKGEVTQQFFSYLDELEGGKWTRKIREGDLDRQGKEDAYFRVGQRVLGFLVEHVM